MRMARYNAALFDVDMREHHSVAGDETPREATRHFFDYHVVPTKMSDSSFGHSLHQSLRKFSGDSNRIPLRVQSLARVQNREW
jgi:hypothetical protein